MRKLLALQGVAGVVCLSVGTGLELGLGWALVAAGVFLLVGAWVTR